MKPKKDNKCNRSTEPDDINNNEFNYLLMTIESNIKKSYEIPSSDYYSSPAYQGLLKLQNAICHPKDWDMRTEEEKK